MEPKFDAHPLETKQDVEGVPLKSVPSSDAGQSDLTSQTPQTSLEVLSFSSSHQQAASSADVSAAQAQPPQETS